MTTPLDFEQTAQTGTFIQNFAAANQINTKEAAWEIVHKAMSIPAFKPFLPDGFTPTDDLFSSPPAATAPRLTLPEMYLFIDAAHRLGDADVVAFVERMRGAVPQAKPEAAPATAPVRRTRGLGRKALAAAAVATPTKAPRATLAPRPASYMLSGNSGKHHEVKSWTDLYLSLMGRVLAKGAKAVAQVPAAWFRAEESNYTTEIPTGTGAHKYAFTTLKVADTQARCSQLLKILHVDSMSVDLKDRTQVQVQAAA